MIPNRSLVIVITLIANLTVLARLAMGDAYVAYEGDILPEANNPPFQYTPGFSGSRSVANGVLTITNTAGFASFTHSREDEVAGDDLAVYQFRTRLYDVGATAPDIIPAAIFQTGWAYSGKVLVMVMPDRVRLRKVVTGPPTLVDWDMPLDTSAWHTYSLVKNRDVNFSLYVDGIKVRQEPMSIFEPPSIPGGYQMFDGNPASSTDWDFVRYAIGDNALQRIAVPEPAGWLVGLACLAFVTCRRKEAR